VECGIFHTPLAPLFFVALAPILNQGLFTTIFVVLAPVLMQRTFQLSNFWRQFIKIHVPMVTILTKKIKFVMKFSNHPSNQMFNFHSKMYVTMYVILRVILKICCILKKLLAPLFSFHNQKNKI
jgi:hypothetical protein